MAALLFLAPEFSDFHRCRKKHSCFPHCNTLKYFWDNLVLKNPNWFFWAGFNPAIRQKLFYHGQFGLTPVKIFCTSYLFGIKCPLIYIFWANRTYLAHILLGWSSYLPPSFVFYAASISLSSSSHSALLKWCSYNFNSIWWPLLVIFAGTAINQSINVRCSCRLNLLFFWRIITDRL